MVGKGWTINFVIGCSANADSTLSGGFVLVGS